MGWTYTQVCVVCACLCVQVSSTPPPGYVKPVETDKHPPKYEFGYDVKDGKGGGQGHLETREGEYALGKYYVNLPSNEQKVDYFADDWGFHPLVEYKTSSGSSSMSTQFALGEKAVAALSRQYGVAPPLEILKTKVSNSLVAGLGPQVSLPASSGIIPGPSAEPVPNSLTEGESYSPSSTAAPSIIHGASPSSLRYETTSAGSNQYSGVSTESSAAGYSSTTENYPSTATAEGTYREAYEGQSSYQNAESGSVGYSSTTENYGSTVGALQGSFELNNGNTYYESESSGRGYGSSTASVISQNREASYSPAPRPYTPVSSETYSQSSSSSAVQDGHQITAYLADSNAAVDVTGKGSSPGLPGLPGVTDYSPNTRISAVLVAEGGNQYGENDIRSEYNRYVSSTTPRPPKTILKPIIVTEGRGAASNLALFSAHGSSGQYNRNKIGKLYHRDNTFNNVGLYTTASVSGSSTVNSLDVDDKGYSTPSSTQEPVLVTPRVESSRLTSSENILAPIQAALSISANHNGEDCNTNTAYGGQESSLVSGPDVEKQELREEAVYKTTVDIQKSIPFEISAEDNQQSQEQYKSSGEEHSSGEIQSGYEVSSQENYQQNLQSEYNQNIAASHQEHQENYETNGHVLNSQVVQTYGAETNDGFQNVYNQNIQLGNQANEHYQQQQQYQDSKQAQDYLNTQNVNNNNFIQQVLFAYHKMANGRPYLPENEAHPTGAPVANQPLFVPNRLHYVYMQRYNPYVNRYGTLYTNYRPSTVQAPSVQLNEANYQTNDEVGQAGRNNENYNIHANSEGHNGLGIIKVASINSNSVYSNSGSQYGSEQAQYVSQNEQSTQANYEHHEAVNAQVSQQAAQEYATQLNALSNSASGEVPHPNINLGNVNAEYSSNREAENQATSYVQYQEGIPAQGSEVKYVEANGNNVNQNNQFLIKELPVPQYIERTKLVEVEKPIHISHPVPIEYTKVIETPVPVAHPIPVPQTQYIERPVPVPQPVPVEVTRVIEKAVPIPHPVPVEYTKVISVEKPVAVPHPVPYPVTKLVAVDRPVAYPHPVPVPYAVPHPIPVPHLVPYPNLVPVPVKDYRPAYFYRKPTGGRLLHRDSHGHHGKNIAFRPSQPVFASQYPPQTYTVMGYFKNPYSRSRGQARKLCIEYGGFKPPMVPSVQVEEDPKPTYGPLAEDKKD